MEHCFERVFVAAKKKVLFIPGLKTHLNITILQMKADDGDCNYKMGGELIKRSFRCGK